MRTNRSNNGELYKRQQLKKHKRLATGLFLLMAVLYIVMTWLGGMHPQGWMGYVRAFAEAAMVGALADWFAVTALFHHPLGLRIPHTNLIEKSKQNIGDNLGHFVVHNFLSSATIRPYISRLAVSSYIVSWLEQKGNKDGLISVVADLLQDIVKRMDDDSVAAIMAGKGREILKEVPLHKFAAQALQYLLERKEEEALITALAAKIKTYIAENQEMVNEKVRQESYFFVPRFVDRKLAEKITGALNRYFEEIEQDKEHTVRKEISTQLALWAHDLETLPKWATQFDRIKSELLSEDRIRRYALDLWQMLRKRLLEELADPQSTMLRYFSDRINEMVAKIKEDGGLRDRIDTWVRHTAYKYILRHAEKVATLISTTIGNWEGKELSRKLELEVGKDLQFIRINGTLVGGLVGLLIYTVTRLLS